MAAPVSLRRKAIQKRSNLCVLFAVLAQVLYMLVAVNAGDVKGTEVIAGVACILLGLISLGFWVAAVSFFAQSKGYSKWWGVAGILSCCGVVLLMVLPNRWMEPGEPAGYGAGDYPRPNG